MQWAVIGCCLAALLALAAGGSKKCKNKQRSLYAHPHWNPKPKNFPITAAYTTFKGILVQPLRDYGNRAIYQSTMMSTETADGSKGPLGYFGVIWKGPHTEKYRDILLFSAWDKKPKGNIISLALDMPTTETEIHGNCQRNCLDGCHHGELKIEGNGAQCKFTFPKDLEEGEEVKLTIEREAVQSKKYKGVLYKGHVWKLSAQFLGGEAARYSGTTFIVGRILFSDNNLDIGKSSSYGINGMSMFHEHIGCMECGAFSFIAQRTGPYITQTAGNGTLPKLVKMMVNAECKGKICTCFNFDIRSDEFGSVKFMTGGEGVSPHWPIVDGKDNNVRLF